MGGTKDKDKDDLVAALARALEGSPRPASQPPIPASPMAPAPAPAAAVAPHRATMRLPAPDASRKGLLGEGG
jgi:hypothetical protein